ncbi:hypothetical protein ABZT49_10535 [Methylobacterium sp. EM32]|uniref:hypothetical protein n=1 Tax=Methylobacterium sp. EM32 TaxID=3163481 RepID=UPI0033BBF4C4
MIDLIQNKELIAAFVGAVATLFAVFLAASLSVKYLRVSELKRLRIKCVVDLISYRFVISGNSTSDAKVVFFAALNAIPSLFGDDHTIMRHLRDFREHDSSKKNDSLLSLIKITAEKSGVSLLNVSDVDLLKPFSM